MLLSIVNRVCFLELFRCVATPRYGFDANIRVLILGGAHPKDLKKGPVLDVISNLLNSFLLLIISISMLE